MISLLGVVLPCLSPLDCPLTEPPFVSGRSLAFTRCKPQLDLLRCSWRLGYRRAGGCFRVRCRLLGYSRAGMEFVRGVSGPRRRWASSLLQRTARCDFLQLLIAVLYHAGVMQWMINSGGGLRKLLRTSHTESLSVAANVFVGQAEAPLWRGPHPGNDAFRTICRWWVVWRR